jgi:hypothetical protein
MLSGHEQESQTERIRPSDYRADILVPPCVGAPLIVASVDGLSGIGYATSHISETLAGDRSARSLFSVLRWACPAMPNQPVPDFTLHRPMIARINLVEHHLIITPSHL